MWDVENRTHVRYQNEGINEVLLFCSMGEMAHPFISHNPVSKKTLRLMFGIATRPLRRFNKKFPKLAFIQKSRCHSVRNGMKVFSAASFYGKTVTNKALSILEQLEHHGCPKAATRSMP
jgi:hypothetical protein